MQFDRQLGLVLRARYLLGFYLMTLALLSGHATAADLESARLWRSPDSTRLVLDLSGAVDHQLIVLKNPDRLVIDISNINLDIVMICLQRYAVPISNHFKA